MRGEIETQPVPIEALAFFTRLGELMLEITRAEKFYGTDLRSTSNELAPLYFEWASNLMKGEFSDDYVKDFDKLRFSVYDTICEDVIKRSSELVTILERLFFVDTSEIRIVIDETKRQKATAQRYFNEERKHKQGIQIIISAVDKAFKVYSDWKAQRRNKERGALKKWCGVLAGIYFPAMGLYFYILSYMKIEADFTLGVVVPVFLALFLIMPLFYLFAPEE